MPETGKTTNIDETFQSLADVPCQKNWTDLDEVPIADLQAEVGCALSKKALTKLLDETHQSSEVSPHTFQNRGYYVREGPGNSRILVWYNEKGHGCRVLTPAELDRITSCWKAR